MKLSPSIMLSVLIWKQTRIYIQRKLDVR
ncbi:hypothetical protein CAEBREN_24496 [Caenorhabditis brenneri]|uniref:Uncharacterized protein n=1 Tax=Caenorhabditis brenneri TaxID=135651 RepID=G0NN16_CAEBE|nr:hypothetical protein CAEBREN_24496 [Caenorhabditis brenneri]